LSPGSRLFRALLAAAFLSLTFPIPGGEGARRPRVPHHATEALAEGRDLLAAGRFAEAVAAFDRALRFGADEAGAHFLLGEAHRLGGNPFSAANAYRSAIRRDPLLAEAHLGLAYTARSTNDVGTVESEASRVLELVPGHPEAHALAGEARARRGDRVGALAHYMEALAAGSGAGDLAFRTADMAKRMGRWDDALVCLAMAERARPLDPGARFQMGLALQRAGALEEAMASYESAVRLDPVHFESLYNMGVIHENAGRIDEAVRLYTMAASARPDDPRPYSQIGYVEQLRGRRLEAIIAYEQFMRLETEPGLREEVRCIIEELREGP
jgi:tetratricopeptide (TPR) repeat protein